MAKGPLYICSLQSCQKGTTKLPPFSGMLFANPLPTIDQNPIKDKEILKKQP
jgi:hypothetical protein